MTTILKKYLKIGGIVFGSILILLVVITLILNFLFKNQLIDLVISQLNKQIDTRINIAKVDLSLWKSFPNISVQFDQVYAQSSNRFRTANHLRQSDTLLMADKIFFEFNVLKLINHQYELKRVYFKNGYIKLKVNNNGLTNYDIIKSSGSKSENTIDLKLNDIVFVDTRVEYTNVSDSLKFCGIADKLQLKGDFTKGKIDLNIYSKFYFNYLDICKYSYISNKNVYFNANLSINESKYKISCPSLRFEKLDINANGEFETGKNGFINLRVFGKHFDLSDLVANLPEFISKDLVNYRFKGKTNAELSIHGKTGKPKNMLLDIKFDLTNGSILHPASGIKLKNLYLKGSYFERFDDTLQTSQIKLDNVSLILGSGKIAGKATAERFYKPKIHLEANYSLNLNELKQFLSLDTLEVFSGTMEGNISAFGTLNLKRSSLKISDINGLVCNGQVNFKDAAIKIKNNDYFLNRINGNVSVDKNLTFNNITVYLHDNDFLINGSLLDWTDYLGNSTNDVTLKADVTSRNLDLSKYFASDEKKASSGYSRELLFPVHLNLDVKLNINKFKLNRFNAKWATGFLSYKPKMFILRSLTFETLDGRVTGNGAILQDIDKNFIVKGQVDVSKVDIKQMFYTFNNFSQNVLRDNHLKGRVSGKIGIAAVWNNAFYLNKDKLLVDADITVENGELIHFEPMYSLSRFIALDELKNIKFSTLKNHIYIKDKQIIIPQMDVHSSAFDISASGTHLFDNHYNYKIKVYLSDILWGKAKRAKRENEEFGQVEDDGLGKTTIPLSITGFNSDYKISYDSRKTLDVVKQSFKTQKNEMKTILNEEFGWFKKDSTLQRGKELKKSSGVRVDWDDANGNVPDKSSDKSTKGKNADSDQKPAIEWEN